MKKTTKPTVAEVLELYDDTKKRYEESGIWGVWEQDERMYELDFRSELLLPKEFADEGVVLPTARDLIDISTDHTNVQNPRVWVGRKGDSKQSEEARNLLRKFGLGVLYRNSIEAPIAPLRVGSKHYWTYGLTILKTVWDADRWVDRPERKDGESEEVYAARIDEWRAEHHDSIPIVILAVHPRNIMLDPYHEGGGFVFETKEELCFDVRERHPQWGNPLAKKISERIEHISFWSKDYRCELYDREPVLKVSGGVAKHSYGFIPYTPIDTGLGTITADNDLKKRYVGILRYIKSLLISESRDYSIGDVILKRTAFPWGYLAGPNAQSVTEVFQKFGEYTTLPEGVTITDMAPKVPPDALLTWLGVAAGYLAAHAAPASLRGMGETGVRSGADRRLIIAEASTRFIYSNEAFRHGVAKVLSNCARIMKNVVPGNINVWAKTPTDEFDIEIKKDKMKEPFTFYVEFAPISEEDEYRRHDDLERLVQTGLVPVKWARQQMSNVDWQEMEREEQMQRIKDDPMVLQVLSQYIAGKLGAAISKRVLAEIASGELPSGLPQGEAQAGTPQGGQPQGGEGAMQELMGGLTTGVPGRAPLGSAQDLQNKLRQQRSPQPLSPGQGQGGGGSRRA